MLLYRYSEPSVMGPALNHPITLITQFHIALDAVRKAEIRYALRRNMENEHIDKIILLNERIYTVEELGVENPKIEQRVIGHHLEFRDVLMIRPFGFLVFANNDIFLDETIASIRRTDIVDSRKMYALLRYEFNGSTKTSQLFGPRADSNDTFILHSNLALNQKQIDLFNFKFGQLGCDNKLCYLFSTFGIKVVNDPLLIRSYHCHSDMTRRYALASLNPPYMSVAPHGVNCPVLGNTQVVIEPFVNQFDLHRQNDLLKNYLLHKRGPFCIPRVAGIENITAWLSAMKLTLPYDLIRVMKQNAGIQFGDVEEYSRRYFAAFEASEIYVTWEPWSNYAKHIGDSLQYVHDKFSKQRIGAHVFDVFNYLSAPWTHALRGKRLLIVSSFAEMMQAQPQAFDIDLFPDCHLQFVKPPLTQGNEPSRAWEREFADFCGTVDALDFDVALCSCGGYGNPLCAHIYATGRSAIYVGGVLQLYFGIYGKRWMLQVPEMMRLHMNSHWKRPIVKPKGFEMIESGCYW